MTIISNYKFSGANNLSSMKKITVKNNNSAISFGRKPAGMLYPAERAITMLYAKTENHKKFADFNLQKIDDGGLLSLLFEAPISKTILFFERIFTKKRQDTEFAKYLSKDYLETTLTELPKKIRMESYNKHGGYEFSHSVLDSVARILNSATTHKDASEGIKKLKF